ncbi:Zinc finger NHR/GATA-type protein [Dioscorea alata]|uniref:Zinc finger NHR/GATA-type protein n=1 Tax=Dioscorea alata TaxID=55571 RepID=A0ACB7WRZ5_DIOAL|nr:Zinc finger NHR/GATA-type protein [Dioscorea alata]
MEEGNIWDVTTTTTKMSNGTGVGDVFDNIDEFFFDLPSDDEQLFGLSQDHNPSNSILTDQLQLPIGPLDLDWLYPTLPSYEDISGNIIDNNNNDKSIERDDGMVSSPVSVLEPNNFGGLSSSISTTVNNSNCSNNSNNNEKTTSAASSATASRRARTKRPRPSTTASSSSSSPRVLVVESFSDQPPVMNKPKYKKRKKNAVEEIDQYHDGDGNGDGDGDGDKQQQLQLQLQQQQQQQQQCSVVRKCMHCGIQKTPQWRAGPMGPKTLCNACGVRYKSGRLFPEYRPAASPTFIPSLHSNSHKKVVEMRLKSNRNQMPHSESDSPALKNCDLIHYIRRKDKSWEPEQDLCVV